jgi:hypothetical protein
LRFKKIASILASTAMVFSTIGFAAATVYPAPFVENGVADAAIVYGSHPSAQSDMVAVVNIQNNLNSFVLEGSVSTPISADCEGETCVSLGKSSDHINLGDTTWPIGTNVDKDDLSVLLEDGTYTADDNDDFDYEQTITLGAKTFSFDRDSNYEDLIDVDGRTPYLGFKYSDGNLILNYTLNFLQDAESSVTDGDLDDFEGSNINLFGRDYYISDAVNGSGTYFGKFTLLDAANSAVLNEGESTTLSVGDMTYEVSVQVFSSTETVLTVNGETTRGLNEGQTYKLSDGTFVGVKDIRYVSKESGVSQVEFSVGTGKIEITSGNEIKINDDTIEGVYGYFTRGTASSGTEKLDKIIIEWRSEDESFLTTESSLTMPGLGGLELSMPGWIRPTEEKVLIENDGGASSAETGGAGISLRVPVEDGNADINILYSNATGSIKGIGKSSTERLATAAGSELIYYNKLGGNDYHNYMVVSYASSDEAESYLISFNPSEDTDAGRNETTVKNEVASKEIASDRTTGLFDTGIGDASFTINSIVVNSTDEWVNITAGSGTNFSTIYTKGGLKIWLPFEDSSITAATTSFSRGLISFADAAISSNTTGYNSDYYYLWMEGEDKNDNLVGGDYFYLTINDNTDEELEVTTVTTEDTNTEQETGDSTKVYETYLTDETAARYLRYSDGNPDSVEVYYPAGDDRKSESYAEVFLTASGAAMGDNPNNIGAPILDTEIANAAGKNIVVVGGSCVNTVAAELLRSPGSERFCGTEWTATTGIGADTFLIQTFTRTGGKVATLVAGWSAIDTQNAATALTTQDVDTTAGKMYTGMTADSIESIM